jgi:Fuc2NAc and GlcNAc transferase
MLLGIFSLQGVWLDSNILWMWIILLGVFIVDSTFTLLRRFLQRAKLYEAHRSHAYQIASRHLGDHLIVTISVSMINILWLLPIALSVVLFDLDGITGVTLAYVPLVLLALRFDAGKVEVS